ncbi:hypothetical protein RUM43_012457 [Polyplax serrata]|uniref:Uncharacterized protein n=1 Tax=Polyplax serrata TaxID=468196 RepID=A0AAN8NKR4_POLSC
MAANALAINMEEETMDEHLVTLMEKLESLRVAKNSANGLTKNFRQPLQVEIRTLEFWRSIISECLASFFFVFIVSGVSCNYLNRGLDKVSDLALPTALATGLAMALLHHCFEKISGGHVNPAVSLAMAAIKKVSPLRASLFVVAQCGGGIAGAALLYG